MRTSRDVGRVSSDLSRSVVRVAGMALVGLMLPLIACSSEGPAAPTSPAPQETTQAAPTAPASPSTAGTKRLGTPEPSAPKTTPVPGSTDQTVAARKQSVAPAARVGAPSSFRKTLVARVSGVKTQTVQAKLPGEVSGPSVVFDLTVRNTGDQTVDLNQLVVNLKDAKGAPAGSITSAPARPMPHVVGAGASARGRYVFVVPRPARGQVTIEVSLTAEDPVLVFRDAVG